jgi:hypothetical protein
MRTLLLAIVALGVVRGALAQPPQDEQPRREKLVRLPDLIKAGDQAPDFKLKTPDGKQQVALSDFRGKRPVALIFGSYT